MDKKIISEFYIASEVPEGGVTLFTLTQDGVLAERSKIPMPSPSWTEVIGGRVCAVLRDRLTLKRIPVRSSKCKMAQSENGKRHADNLKNSKSQKGD